MRALQQAWLRRGPLAWMLRPVSLAYGALVAVRRLLFRLGIFHSTRLAVPVIVVGNVVAGGAGKTPVVIALVEHLRAMGMTPGVVSRGYGRRSGECTEVLPASRPEEVGDEPLLVARRTGAPVFVAARRADAGYALLKAHPKTSVIVSDDGLQHLALARDVEICVFDTRVIGNGWLLPAGPLREPWPRKVDFALHDGGVPNPSAAPAFAISRRLAAQAVDAHGNRVALDELRGHAITAVAAVARPHAFFGMLRACGLTLAHTVALADHAGFEGWQPPGPGTLLCTEKDAVKLWAHHPQALAVPLELEVPAAFWQALDARLSSLHGHQTA